MNTKNRFIVYCVMFFLLFLPQLSNAKSGSDPKVAVFPFNTTPSSKIEIGKSISEMIMTNLGKSDRLILVERLQVDRALVNFKIEQIGIVDESTAIEIGQWLGASKLILGHYTQLGQKVRIDARVVDVKRGTLQVSEKLQGRENNLFDLVDKLSTKLLESFTGEYIYHGGRETIFSNKLISFRNYQSGWDEVAVLGVNIPSSWPGKVAERRGVCNNCYFKDNKHSIPIEFILKYKKDYDRCNEIDDSNIIVCNPVMIEFYIVTHEENVDKTGDLIQVNYNDIYRGKNLVLNCVKYQCIAEVINFEKKSGYQTMPWGEKHHHKGIKSLELKVSIYKVR